VGALKSLSSPEGVTPKAFEAPLGSGGVARWVRWVFEAQAPADEFQRLLERGLTLRGVAVEPAEHFHFTARALGARAFVEIAWAEQGLEVRVKLKAGLFASSKGLERLLLEAGREAQARLLPNGPPGRMLKDPTA